MTLFTAITVGVLVACILGIFAKILKQPPVVGYIIAGLILVFLGVDTTSQKPVLDGLAQLGVTFLLFLMGLEMNLKDLVRVGGVVLTVGFAQIIVTALAGFSIAYLLSFSSVESSYIALVLTFSSTIVIVKLLSEKRDLESLYGKLVLGILLVQDLVAILSLAFLSGFRTQTLSQFTFLLVLFKGLGLLFLVYILSKFVLPKLFDKIATLSSELLFVSSIAWVLLLGSAVSSPWVGFSTEVGGLLAGIALASSSSHLQIGSRVKPLRDFFITIFFLSLGLKMAPVLNLSVIIPAVLISLFVVLVKPLIVMAALGWMGYKKRTSFLAGSTVGQLSEFSLIVVSLGLAVGHISQSVAGVIALVTIITMTASTYFITNSNGIFQKISGLLAIFEKKNIKENAFAVNKTFCNHVVIIGCDRTGKRLLPTFKRLEEQVVIVDFNPTVVEKLIADGYTAFYGDVSDVDTLASLNLAEAKLIISTIGSLEDNLILLEYASRFDPRPLMIFTSTVSQDAISLYEKGANYVVVPQVVGGDHLAQLFSYHGLRREYYKNLRDRHFDRLAKERWWGEQ